MKAKNVALISIAVIIVCASAAFFFVSRTPRYAFYRVGKAIRTHDVELFTTYVDVDTVVDEWVAWGAAKAKQELLDLKSELENPLGEGMIELMMPNLRMKLKEEFKRSIMQSFETGMPSDDLPLLNMALLPIKRFEVKKRTAQIMVQHPQKDEQIFFKLHCMPRGYWRIVSIQIPSMMRLADRKEHPKNALPPLRTIPLPPETSPSSAILPAPETPQSIPPPVPGPQTDASSFQREYILSRTIAFTEYYQLVRDRIKDKIGVYANKGYKGEVTLKVVLLSNGAIKSLVVDDAKDKTNKRLKELTLKAAREAAPYPKFPKELQSAQESFDILVSFE